MKNELFAFGAGRPTRGGVRASTGGLGGRGRLGAARRRKAGAVAARGITGVRQLGRGLVSYRVPGLRGSYVGRVGAGGQITTAGRRVGNTRGAATTGRRRNR